MCGIVGYLGSKECFDTIIMGLEQLQNRGYDSAGVGGVKDGAIIYTKYATTDKIDSIQSLNWERDDFRDCTNMIGHTRWATHGPKTKTNSHPHLDYKKRLAVVHNGMIENYFDLSNELITEHRVTFRSQTDTEVIANLISVYYDETEDENGVKHMEEAIMMAVNRLRGTWALTIISKDKPDNMYCARHGSPLLIGFGEDSLMVASEQAGFCGLVSNYVCLDNNDLTVLRRRSGKVTMQNVANYIKRDISADSSTLKPDPYPNWTLKEIHEQYEASIRAIGLGGRLQDNGSVRLGGPTQYSKELMEIDHLILLGCGTSLNAALHSADFFYDLCELTTVQVFSGPLFQSKHIPPKGKTALVFLSQSGETKDLYRCVKIGKDRECLLVGVINVVDSLIAREVDCGCYLNAGREVGVASTKAFTSQVIVLSMLAVHIAQIKNIHMKKRERYIKSLRQLPQDIISTIHNTKPSSRKVAEYLINHQHCYILGKGSLYAVAMEGSLKTKEIGYIHSEAYEGNALRHGPYALLEKGTPVIFLAPDDENMCFIKNTIEEVKSREATVITITDHDSDIHASDYEMRVASNEVFKGILHNIPMQLVAYHLGISKGIDVDRPRNLAKTVTV